MDGGFGNDVGVEAVAQVDRVDVVTARRCTSKVCPAKESTDRKQGNSPFQIAVHDGEEHLEEEVDGVDQHRQQVEPRFAGHHGHEIDSSRSS